MGHPFTTTIYEALLMYVIQSFLNVNKCVHILMEEYERKHLTGSLFPGKTEMTMVCMSIYLY